MTVTAKEIAGICGVSRGTVDRALNNRTGINTGTRKKILKTAEELGYRPDFLAKSLATGKTATIGVVVFDVYSRFFGQLVHSIENKARELGFFVYLTLTLKNGRLERQCIQHLLNRKADGIVLFSVNRGDDFEAFLRKIKVPVVTIVNKIHDSLDYIGIDDYGAVLDAVGFLSRYGHRDIVYVSTPPNAGINVNMHAVERRLSGFIDGCKKFGAVNNRQYLIAEKGYPEAVLKMMDQKNHPTAVLCSNDIYALEIMKALKARGYRIPDDVSLMGFDNIDALEYIEPGLTTVGCPIGELGRLAVEILTGRIKGENRKKPEDMILEHKLVVRDSVGYV